MKFNKLMQLFILITLISCGGSKKSFTDKEDVQIVKAEGTQPEEMKNEEKAKLEKQRLKEEKKNEEERIKAEKKLEKERAKEEEKRKKEEEKRKESGGGTSYNEDIKTNDLHKNFLFNFDHSDNLAGVLKKAKSEKKWVYLDIGTKWCVPCQLMKRDVYSHDRTANLFNQNFISYLVDAEKNEGPDLKLIYDVKSYPTLFILNENGREMLRHDGAMLIDSITNFANQAIDMKKKEKGI